MDYSLHGSVVVGTHSPTYSNLRNTSKTLNNMRSSSTVTHDVRFENVFSRFKILNTAHKYLISTAIHQNNNAIIFTGFRKASAVYATANPAVRPSVRPSHSGIVSKQGNAKGCGLHHQVAQCLAF